MLEAKVVKTVAAPAEAVWNILSDFGGIQPGGPVEAVRVEGEGVGMVRYLTIAGKDLAERLDEHDPQTHSFSYSIINDDHAMPFLNYSASVQITALSDDSCSVDWRGRFDARGDEETAINTATGIYAGAIKATAAALGAD